MRERKQMNGFTDFMYHRIENKIAEDLLDLEEAGSSVQQKSIFKIDLENSVLGISKISDENVHKVSVAKQRLNHLSQGKYKIVQVEICDDETMQLHDEGRKIRQNKLNEQK